MSPATPWAVVSNGWGILNLPLAAWGLMPGYNVVLLEAMPWIAGTMTAVSAAISASRGQQEHVDALRCGFGERATESKRFIIGMGKHRHQPQTIHRGVR